MALFIRNSRKSRGLEKLKERMSGFLEEIDRRLKHCGRLRILEVGCGYGAALLDLKKRYGDRLELQGIDREPSHGGRDTMTTLAERRGLFSAEQLAGDGAPVIHYFDVSQPWPLASGQFDLVFSQHAFLWFADKIRPIEEIHRVLAPGGQAFIDLLIEERGPVRENSIVILDDQRKFIPFRELVASVAAIRVIDPERSAHRRVKRWIQRKLRVKRPSKERPYLVLDKDRVSLLHFGLEFVSATRFAENGGARKGRQSFYRTVQSATTTAPGLPPARSGESIPVSDDATAPRQAVGQNA